MSEGAASRRERTAHVSRYGPDGGGSSEETRALLPREKRSQKLVEQRYSPHVRRSPKSLGGRTFTWLCLLQFLSTTLVHAYVFTVKDHSATSDVDLIGVPAWVLAAETALRIAVLAYSAWIVGTQNRSLTLPPALWVYLVVASLPSIQQILAGGDAARLSLALAQTIVFALAVASLSLQLEDLRAVGVLGVVSAVAALVFAATFPQTSFMPSEFAQKLPIIDSALAGPFDHSNTLGIILASAVPFITLFRRTVLRRASISVVLFAALWTTSRTSLSALALAGLVGLAWWASRRLGRLVAALLMVSGAIACVVLPFVTSDPGAYSDRGNIWQWALAAWRAEGSVLFGVSPVWPWLASTGAQAPAPSAHNLFVQALFTGGLVLVVAIGALVRTAAARALRATISHESITYAVFMVIVLTISIFEYAFLPTPNSPLFVFSAIPILTISIADERAS